MKSQENTTATPLSNTLYFKTLELLKDDHSLVPHTVRLELHDDLWRWYVSRFRTWTGAELFLALTEKGEIVRGTSTSRRFWNPNKHDFDSVLVASQIANLITGGPNPLPPRTVPGRPWVEEDREGKPVEKSDLDYLRECIIANTREIERLNKRIETLEAGQ